MGLMWFRTPSTTWWTTTAPRATITTLGRTCSTTSQITSPIGLWYRGAKTSSMKDRIRPQSHAPAIKAPTYLATKSRREAQYSPPQLKSRLKFAKETKKHSKAKFLGDRHKGDPRRETRRLFKVQFLARPSKTQSTLRRLGEKVTALRIFSDQPSPNMCAALTIRWLRHLLR